MSIPQSSLDSILGAAGRDGAGPHGVEEGDVDQQALLNYLDQEYSDVLASGGSHQDVPSSAVQASLYRLSSSTQGQQPPQHHQQLHQHQHPQQPQSQQTLHAADSPSAIPIPQSLLQLASTTPALSIDLVEVDPLIDATIAVEEYGDRGEMGGRRRKNAWERAGWKEMDEGPRKKTKRAPRGTAAALVGADAQQSLGSASEPNAALAGTSKGAAASDASPAWHEWKAKADHERAMRGSQAASAGQDRSQQQDGSLDSLQHDLQQHAGQSAMYAQPEQDQTALAGATGAFDADSIGQQQQQQQPKQPGQEDGQDAEGASGSNDKLDRAEQNRRAQQVYRRKREERMRHLEAAAAALDPTRKALADVQAKLRDLAQSHEASRLEVVALRSALVKAAEAGATVLAPDGSLLVSQPGDEQHQATRESYEMQRAFETLEAQTRELARVRLDNSRQ